MIATTSCSTCLGGLLHPSTLTHEIEQFNFASLELVLGVAGVSRDVVMYCPIYRLIDDLSATAPTIASCNGRNAAYIPTSRVKNVMGKSSRFLSVDLLTGKKLQYLQGGFL